MKNLATKVNETDDELLTSYLDQELSVADRVAFERRLVDDEPLRQRLAELRRAWDLLDELPETPFTPNFTQSTLEMVAIDLEKEKERAQPILGLPMPQWVPKTSLRLRAALLVTSAILLGALIGLAIRVRNRTFEAYDLAIAARIPTLQDFPRLEVLRPLTSLPGWKALLDNSAIRDRILTTLPSDHDRSSVEDYVNRLDTHQKEVLWSRKQTLDKLNPSERDDLVNRYEAAIRIDKSDADLQLMATLLNGILQSMTMSERAELRTLSEDRRIARLTEELCFRLANAHFAKLEPREKAHIQDWKLKRLIPQLIENAPFPMNSPEFNGSPDRFIFGFIYFAMRNGANSINGQEALIDSLCDGLSEHTVKLIRGMSTRHQTSIIQYWTAAEYREPGKSISTDDLYKQYQELDSKRREEIDLKRPEDTRHFLEGRDVRRRGPLDRTGPRPDGGLPGLGPGFGPGPSGIGPGQGPGPGGRGPGGQGPNSQGPGGMGPGRFNPPDGQRGDRPAVPPFDRPR